MFFSDKIMKNGFLKNINIKILLFNFLRAKIQQKGDKCKCF